VAVELTDVRKQFGATQALRGVTLVVDAGSIHAMIGENGAGKSTALGIVAGRTAPTSGSVRVFGDELHHGHPRDARRHGVVAIYQELTIIPTLTAEANVFLADPVSHGGFLDEREMRKRYVALCERVGIAPIAPKTLAGRLSVADQQMLEILRGLVGGARILLLDEPTSALGPAESDALFRLMTDLRADGMTIVFVSHNLDDVLQLGDVITVFRDGQVKVTDVRQRFTKAGLVQAMLGASGDARVAATLLESDHGEDSGEAGGRKRGAARATKEPALAASGITVPGVIEDVALEVGAGEILGIGGLVGSGRTTLLRALAGLQPVASGEMWIKGVQARWPRTAHQALGMGIAMVPEDRKTQGLVLPLSVMENIAMSDLGKTGRMGFISPGSMETATEEVAASFGLPKARLRQAAWQLSGGNQQRLLIARWVHSTPAILLADEPTRGVDVGAKEDILRQLESLAAAGLGVVIVSSELEEVTAISDRVVVLARGRMVGVFDSAEQEITPSDILHLAFGVERELAASRADT
jgi:ABC-type sugar transport system ATPase subunit